MNTFYEKAYDLVGDQKAQDAFDIEKEKPEVRDRYGRNTAGARMLMSRRLVEAGARFVSMTYGSWDMHQNIFGGIDSQVPPFDQAFAALIQDLTERGLLESTLVCVVSEFGRTPKINKDAGRDHYPKVFSSILAGGGIKGRNDLLEELMRLAQNQKITQFLFHIGRQLFIIKWELMPTKN